MSDVDLDAKAPSPSRRRPAWLALLVLIALAAAAGAGARAVSLAAAPEPPVVGGRLSLHEAYLDGAGRPVATLRLILQNDGPEPLLVRSMEAHGLDETRDSFHLDTTLAPGRPAMVDIEVRPSCPLQVFGGGSDDLVDARLTVVTGDIPAGRRGGGADSSDGRDPNDAALEGTVVTARGLGLPGGLCRQVTAALPAGWRLPLRVGRVAATGPTLHVDIAGLDERTRIAGVWAGGQLLVQQADVAPEPGGIQHIRLERPRACALSSGSVRIPTGLRVLAVGDTGLREYYAPVGPALADWLLHTC